jgi:hypothetical protein
MQKQILVETLAPISTTVGHPIVVSSFYGRARPKDHTWGVSLNSLKKRDNVRVMAEVLINEKVEFGVDHARLLEDHEKLKRPTKPWRVDSLTSMRSYPYQGVA